jgi:hypothetical protein
MAPPRRHGPAIVLAMPWRGNRENDQAPENIKQPARARDAARKIIRRFGHFNNCCARPSPAEWSATFIQTPPAANYPPSRSPGGPVSGNHRTAPAT